MVENETTARKPREKEENKEPPMAMRLRCALPHSVGLTGVMGLYPIRSEGWL